MIKLLDQQSDIGQRVGYKLACLVAMPEYVQQAPILDSDALTEVRTEFFAWPKDRRLPCHTKAATLLSRLFYEFQRHAVEPSAQQIIERNFSKMASWWNIAADVERAVTELQTGLQRELAQKTAARKHEEMVQSQLLNATVKSALQDYLVSMVTGDSYFVDSLTKAGLQPYAAVDAALTNEICDESGMQPDPVKLAEVLPTLPRPDALRLRGALQQIGVHAVEPELLQKKVAELDSESMERIARRAGAKSLVKDFTAHFSRANHSRYAPQFMTSGRLT